MVEELEAVRKEFFKFEVFTAVKVHGLFIAFMMPCSEESSLCHSKIVVPMCQTIECHSPRDHNMNETFPLFF
jgi:hypothetical protein